MKTSPAIALAITTALVTGCAAAPGSNGQPTAEPYTTPEQASTQVTQATHNPTTTGDPLEIGKTFVTAAYTWDTHTGTHLTEAFKRVDYMATDELAAQFITPQSTSKRAAWNQATKNQAHTEPKVTIVPEGNQALMKSRPETKKAAYMVTWKWAGPGGYRQDGGKDLVILTLTDTKQGWKIASFEPTPIT